jgi:glycosyltransferase involved in cell wall biosynthesis
MRVELPLVSVLTPSFEQGRFLGDCLASVGAQTYRSLEHIICDGGSSDETIDVLRAQQTAVRWVSEPDRGQAHALNKALALSRGEIIGWLNSDDAYFSPTAVADAARVFARRPDVDVVYGHAALIDAKGRLLHLIWVPPFSVRLLHLSNFLIQPAVFIRRSALGESVADEAYDYSMDRELWYRLSRAGSRFERLDRVLAAERHHPLRKVETRPDLAAADDARLVATYGVPAATRRKVTRKAVKVGSRLWGSRLLPQARGELAFAGGVDSFARLALRQVAMPRAAMTSEPPRPPAGRAASTG